MWLPSTHAMGPEKADRSGDVVGTGVKAARRDGDDDAARGDAADGGVVIGMDGAVAAQQCAVDIQSKELVAHARRSVAARKPGDKRPLRQPVAGMEWESERNR